jgi:hypothetical protein
MQENDRVFIKDAGMDGGSRLSQEMHEVGLVDSKGREGIVVCSGNDKNINVTA